MKMNTTTIRAKIDELDSMIRVLRDEISDILENGNDSQYIEAIKINRLLEKGLRNLEDLTIAVELAEELLQA